MNDHNNSDEDDTSTASTPTPGNLRGVECLNFQRRISLSFLARMAQAKPDLTIQTGGHLGLRVPKKILSSSLLDDSSSPTGHGLKVPKKILNPSHMDESPNMNSKRKELRYFTCIYVSQFLIGHIIIHNQVKICNM